MKMEEKRGKEGKRRRIVEGMSIGISNKRRWYKKR
jgi:hypothetical protein